MCNNVIMFICSQQHNTKVASSLSSTVSNPHVRTVLANATNTLASDFSAASLLMKKHRILNIRVKFVCCSMLVQRFLLKSFAAKTLLKKVDASKNEALERVLCGACSTAALRLRTRKIKFTRSTHPYSCTSMESYKY